MNNAGSPIISVLIPVYNWDITQLLSTLIKEIEISRMHNKIELIILDDASDDGIIVNKNRAFCYNVISQKGIKLEYKENQVNVGRAKVRNILINSAVGNYVLFMDCDGLPDGEDYLRTYFCFTEQHYDAVCGGRSYRQSIKKDKIYDFHTIYVAKTEVVSAEVRNDNMWRYIFTANIMVKRDVLDTVPFDESFTRWGGEDIEWGIRLCEKCNVIHIENTVSHMGLKTKSQLLSEREQAIHNVLRMACLHPEIIAHSPIHQWVAFLYKLDVKILNNMHQVLVSIILYRHTPNVVAWPLFQLNRAVLLTLEYKNQDQDIITTAQG